MAFILRSNGSVEIVEIDQSEDSLKQAQEIVGGYVEIIPIYDGSFLMVNEDAKMMNLPENKNATLLWGVCREDVFYSGEGQFLFNDTIRGDVIHVLRTEIIDCEGAFDEDCEDEEISGEADHMSQEERTDDN
jgi:hypothetical protein